MADAKILQMLAGLKRNEVEWNPTIDYDLCSIQQNVCYYAIDVKNYVPTGHYLFQHVGIY